MTGRLPVCCRNVSATILSSVFLTAALTSLPVFAQEEITWALDVKYDRPQQVLMDLPLSSEQPYWYMLYEVTNNTSRDRYLFLKSWIVVNSDEEKRKYQDRLIPALESKVEKTFDRKFDNRVELMGKIKKGETKHCIALFGSIGYDIKHAVIYVDGLTKNILNRDEETGRPFFQFRRARVFFERQGTPEEEPYTVLLKKRTDFKTEILQVPDEALESEGSELGGAIE